jgi:hypothetical protein
VSWQLSAAVRGNLKDALARDLKAAEGAVMTVIRRRTTVLRDAVRRQVSVAGMGEQLGKAAKLRVMPDRGASIRAKGVVYSKALYKTRPGGLVDLFTVFDEGATVAAQGGKYLALQIGTGIQFGKSRRAKAIYIDPKTMAVLRLKSGKGYLVVRKEPHRGRDISGHYGQPLLLLIKQVHIKKRLDLQAALDYASQGLDELVAREWERRVEKAGVLE